MYEGPPTIFRFDEVDPERGLFAPHSLINLGFAAFYLAKDGFFAFNGNQSVPIGAGKIDNTFWNDLDQTHFPRISVSSDIRNKLIIWAYPGSGNVGGNPNKLLIYNWQLDRWSYGETEVELLASLVTPGLTLDQLDTITTDLDALPFSLDSVVWTEGSVPLSGINTDHKLVYFDGTAKEAIMETGEFGDGNGNRSFLTGLRPFVDGGAPTVSLGHRNKPQETPAYTTATIQNNAGVCPQRKDSRYFRARVTIPAAASWTHAQGVEPYFVKSGER
jgi:hypothetical protein